jgi:hypothetical protein
MFLPEPIPAFGITHPLGLPRPVDPENFFGAKPLFFARNLMPVPTGCLDYFDSAVYRPYVRSLVAFLNAHELGWGGPAIIDGPSRYCLLRGGVPASVPADLRPLLPEPPKISLRRVLNRVAETHATTNSLQLLDVLTLVSEDLGPEKFALATLDYPWVAAFMR